RTPDRRARRPRRYRPQQRWRAGRAGQGCSSTIPPSSGTKLISRAQRRRGEAVVGGQPLVVIGSPEAVADGTAGGGPSPGGVGVGIGRGVGASAGAGAAGLGWFYSSVLLDTSIRPVCPERVLAVSDGEVTLAASRLTAQPGIWGLRWATDRGADGLAVLGPPAAQDRREVVRPLRGGDRPEPATAAVLDAGPYDPDPSARGLEFSEVDVPGPLGRYPAWLVPADGDTWVVLVHGRGGARREA